MSILFEMRCINIKKYLNLNYIKISPVNYISMIICAIAFLLLLFGLIVDLINWEFRFVGMYLIMIAVNLIGILFNRWCIKHINKIKRSNSISG